MSADVSLVLDKYEFTPEAKDGDILVIEGRNSGLVGRLLTSLGLTEKSTLTINREQVSFKFTSLRGVTHIVCPLDAVTCSMSGTAKPMWMLYLGIAGLLAGITGWFGGVEA